MMDGLACGNRAAKVGSEGYLVKRALPTQLYTELIRAEHLADSGLLKLIREPAAGVMMKRTLACELARVRDAQWRPVAAAAFLLAVLTFSGAGRAWAADIFVAPAGVTTNNGSVDHPIDLASALSVNSPARPGDTIWLLAGTYVGTYKSYLQGTPTAPITVRQYPGGRATLDGAGSPNTVLEVLGQWAVFQGFEITNSDPHRRSAQAGSWPTDLTRGAGVVASGLNLKFINLVLHDLNTGLAFWSDSVGTEVYGCLIYYNGWQGPDRSHGHGIYTQNQIDERLLRENIVFDQFDIGIHAYGSSVAFLNNITMEGNVAFDNGILGLSGFSADLLLGGGVVAQNPVFRENFTYGGGQSDLGYGAGCVNGLVMNNYFVGSTPLILANCAPVMAGNVFYNLQAAQWGWWAGNFRPQDYPSNMYYAQPPATNFITARPNVYEAGRGHVVVYNWQHQDTVQVDLSTIGLKLGDAFEVRDAENFFGAPVVAAHYDGSPVSIPMDGLTLAPPIGDVSVTPQHTGPEFGVFVVVRVTNGSPPATVATPTISPAGGTFTAPVTVSLGSTTAGAAIRYTTDGSVPTGASPLYAGPFVLASTTTVSARAMAASMLDSAVATAVFTVVPPPTVAAPTISPAGGTFTAPVTVSLESTTAGAAIRYTTDGSVPTSASFLYAGPFVLSSTTTVTARAMAAGMLDSAVASASFTVSTPGTDDTPPAIFNPSITAVTQSSVTVTWTTSKPADSMLLFLGQCPNESPGNWHVCIAANDPMLVTTHSTTVTGLLPDSTYTFQIWSTDANGHYAYSPSLEFRTSPALAVRTPVAR
jgi:hypothetical protein